MYNDRSYILLLFTKTMIFAIFTLFILPQYIDITFLLFNNDTDVGILVILFVSIFELLIKF